MKVKNTSFVNLEVIHETKRAQNGAASHGDPVSRHVTSDLHWGSAQPGRVLPARVKQRTGLIWLNLFVSFRPPTKCHDPPRAREFPCANFF